mgnify:CR=1 FL=1
MKRLLSILASLILVATFAIAATIDKKGEMKDMEEPVTAKAIFAGGCFWCMEPPFEKLEGVHAVVSGYIDGHKENPTYQEVSSGTTGHTEAVEITYDPGKISFAELLEVFWMNIDPTDAGGQFVDRGSQFRVLPLEHQVQGIELRSCNVPVKIVRLQVQGVAVGQKARQACRDCLAVLSCYARIKLHGDSCLLEDAAILKAASSYREAVTRLRAGSATTRSRA